METKKYLDEAGLRILWGKIKSGQAKLAGDIATLEAALRGEISGVAGNLNNYVLTSAKGAANGVASLDNTGKVPAAQLPGYVDDVIEGKLADGKFIPGALVNGNFSPDANTLEEKNEDGSLVPKPGKIYVDVTNNKTYRWSGTQYTAIGGDLALGITASTAFPGNRGSELEDQVANLEELTESYETQVKTKEINFEDDTFLTRTGIRTSQSFGITINYDDSEQRETITFEDGGVAHTTGNLQALTENEINAVCV